jgi:Tfp pilus assembly protein PilO
MIKNLPKEKRDHLLLVAIITLAITVGAYFGLVKMQQRKLARIATQTTEQEDKVGGAVRLVSTHEETQQNLEDSLQKLQGLEQNMASGDMYSWVITTLNRFRADRKVEIPQFSREITTDVGLFPKFPYKAALFHIRGTAYFHELGKFIADFENTFPHIRIQNIDMEPAAQSAATATPGSDPEKLAFKMEIVALINPNVAP